MPGSTLVDQAGNISGEVTWELVLKIQIQFRSTEKGTKGFPGRGNRDKRVHIMVSK